MENFKETMIAIVENKKKMAKYRRCAKALLLVGDIAQASVYLDAVAELGGMTQKEADEMLDSITKECAGILVCNEEALKKQIEGMVR